MTEFYDEMFEAAFAEVYADHYAEDYASLYRDELRLLSDLMREITKKTQTVNQGEKPYTMPVGLELKSRASRMTREAGSFLLFGE